MRASNLGDVYLSRLALTDFRSYTDMDLCLESGVSTLIGANGQGKTNVVEAVGYLATLSSHRVASDAPLVRHGAERAILRGAVTSAERDSLVEIEINPGRANRARLNRTPVPRARQVLGALRTVLFAPEDLSLVKGDPEQRRRYLDDLLVARAPRYAGVRAEYERVLRQRTALLKSLRGRPWARQRTAPPPGSPGGEFAADQAHPAVDLVGPGQRQRLAQTCRELFHVGLGLGPDFPGPAAGQTVDIADKRLTVANREPSGVTGHRGVRLGGQRPERAGQPDPGYQQLRAGRGQVLVPDVERGRGGIPRAAVAGLLRGELAARGPGGRGRELAGPRPPA